MGIFKRRRDDKEEKQSEFFRKKADPEMYFTATVGVVFLILYILYIYLKDFYFEL